jgi:hypothetical protein
MDIFSIVPMLVQKTHQSNNLLYVLRWSLAIGEHGDRSVCFIVFEGLHDVPNLKDQSIPDSHHMPFDSLKQFGALSLNDADFAL